MAQQRGEVLFRYPGVNGVIYNVAFWCPACNCEHPYRIVPYDGGPVWAFNGDFIKPVFSPSLLVYKGGRGTGTGCHLFVGGSDGSKPGMIEYCSDCPHDWAGKTVPMIPFNIDTWDWDYPAIDSVR